ncbi:MAG: DegT/DnrJ/EryC1/StrS family aminotransferase [Deltaproteobacteria bacterium]|nr:DegT/DnrJ/EryC1/StrS family aminotransferase [Deltaproteobacteria bacterium]
MKTIPLTKPYIDEEELKAVLEPLKSGWLVQGTKVVEFEKVFSNFIGDGYTCAVSNCTAALHIALTLLGIKENDEVILPAFTYVATANAIEYLKAKPVFVDINIDTFNIKTEDIEKKITNKTKVIIPVHLFGLCADIDPILNLANKYKLKIVEDAACALGSYYKDTHAGLFGDIGCFSFHPRKIITTGEGGMIVTKHKPLIEKAKSLRDHGAKTSDLQRHNNKLFLMPEFNELGFNYRMTDIQASIGLSQMKKVPDLLAKRKEMAQRYHDPLSDIPWIKIPVYEKNYLHSYQAYVLRINKNYFNGDMKIANSIRNRLVEYFTKNGIFTRPGTHAVPTLGYYKNKYGFKNSDFPASVEAETTTITLPLFYQLKDEEQEKVVKTIKEFGEKI